MREASGAAGRAGMPPAATPSVGEVPGVPAFVRPSSVEPDEWRELARCSGVNPDLFFPERGASTYEAKQVCRACPVKAECLEYALVNGRSSGSGVVCRSWTGVVCAGPEHRCAGWEWWRDGVDRG